MNAIIFHGTAQSRNIIKDTEWNYVAPGFEKVLKWNVLLTTYETVLQERAVFEKIDWQYLIVDEAHRLKNKTSRITNALEQVKYKSITLLTGTPIQNNTKELYTLLNILDPKRFLSDSSPLTSCCALSLRSYRRHWSDFEEKFGELKEVAQVQELQKILQKYLVRFSLLDRLICNDAHLMLV